MGRILAIDYGRKRVGLAVTDPMQIVPHGLTTVRACDAADFIAKYVERESVERVIIGLPRQMSGQLSESVNYIRPFANKLKTLVQVPVEFVDERFTSVLAHRTMLDAGLKKKDRQNKALVDEISATIILQSYLDNRTSVTEIV